MMQYFLYLDKREILQQEYSQPRILPSPHFRWVENHLLPFQCNVASTQTTDPNTEGGGLGDNLLINPGVIGR